jgi:hypothetical protein
VDRSSRKNTWRLSLIAKPADHKRNQFSISSLSVLAHLFWEELNKVVSIKIHVLHPNSWATYLIDGKIIPLAFSVDVGQCGRNGIHCGMAKGEE